MNRTDCYIETKCKIELDTNIKFLKNVEIKKENETYTYIIDATYYCQDDIFRYFIIKDENMRMILSSESGSCIFVSYNNKLDTIEYISGSYEKIYNNNLDIDNIYYFDKNDYYNDDLEIFETIINEKIERKQKLNKLSGLKYYTLLELSNYYQDIKKIK